jgi:CHASE3 domain sensor protein
MPSLRGRDLLTRWALVVPVLFSLGLAVLNNLSQGEINQSAGWVRHTLEVEVALRHLQDVARNAEAAQRGILLAGASGQRRQYGPYRMALDSIDPAIRQLAVLTADNPDQVSRARHLGDMAGRYVTSLDAAVTLDSAGRGESALVTVQTSTALGNELHDMVEGGLAQERGLLIGREQELHALLERRQKLGFGLVALNVILLLGFLYLLRRFQKQQNMVKVCAWSRVIQHNGQWITFEQYLSKQFDIDVTHGMSPEIAERLLAPTEDSIA